MITRSLFTALRGFRGCRCRIRGEERWKFCRELFWFAEGRSLRQDLARAGRKMKPGSMRATTSMDDRCNAAAVDER